MKNSTCRWKFFLESEKKGLSWNKTFRTLTASINMPVWRARGFKPAAAFKSLTLQTTVDSKIRQEKQCHFINGEWKGNKWFVSNWQWESRVLGTHLILVGNTFSAVEELPDGYICSLLTKCSMHCKKTDILAFIVWLFIS